MKKKRTGKKEYTKHLNSNTPLVVPGEGSDT